MNRVGLYIRRFREGEEPRLLSVHKWAQKLRFSEFERNEWGYIEIERTEDLKSCRNQAFPRAANFFNPAKICNPCEVLQGYENQQPLRKLAFNPLKNCTPPENNCCKKKHQHYEKEHIKVKSYN